MDRGAWWATVRGVTKDSDTTQLKKMLKVQREFKNDFWVVMR